MAVPSRGRALRAMHFEVADVPVDPPGSTLRARFDNRTTDFESPHKAARGQAAPGASEKH